MNKEEYQDHPEKLMGWQEFKDMGKGTGDAVKPDWIIKNQMKALEEDEDANSQ